MSSIKIAGEEYPVKLGMRAMSDIAKKAGGKGKLQECLAELQDPTIENLPDYVLALIKNGIKYTGADIKPPKLADIEKELDNDFSFWADAVQAVTPDFEQPGPPDEGN